MNKFLPLFLCISLTVQAQKQLSLTVYFPSSLQDKLRVAYYTGKETKEVFAHGDSIVIKDTFYTLYAVCTFAYPTDKPFVNQWAVYYANEKPAVVRLQEPDVSKPLFANAVLKNLIDAGSLGPDQLEACTQKEMAAMNEEMKKIQGLQFIGDSMAGIISNKGKIIVAKRLQCVKDNAHLYYSFFTFGQGLINTREITVDSLFTIFHTFPAKFKNSYEGKEMVRLLHTRKLREQKMIAPDFTVKDIDNNTVSLKQFKGKYVLINFWASWCGGCIEEFPALDSITAGIPAGQMVTVYITEDKDKTAFERARKKYNRQGIHIFATNRLIRDYKAFSIPQLYLIDQQGRIIYDRDLTDDYQLKELAGVVQKIWPKQ